MSTLITITPQGDGKVLPARILARGQQTEESVLAALEASIPHLPYGWVGLTEDDKPIFDGGKLFDLKATHGLPLDFAVDRIFERGYVVGWPDFIEAARRNKWVDYQTYEAISHAVADAMLPKETQEGILAGCRLHIMSPALYVNAPNFIGA